MAGFCKLSEAAKLAFYIMAISAAQKSSMRAKEYADLLCASEAHISKVLQQLRRAGMLASRRGPTGGFTLLSNPEDLHMIEILEAIDGNTQKSNCFFENMICTQPEPGSDCIFQEITSDLNRRILDFLSTTTLQTIAERYAKRFN